ncbi:M23 family metallopeptidase [Alcanivorax jadensis]|uniref:M23 family metallopeptidase n=1 Tax=Alcanivorax jadensis TaxID=64988 RepID=UPI0023538375|nr:M23 family metallopeptidase [Alcanivorax jadensis]|tara:strand:+ start:453 stop:863 length:411 start_codon:yes stop_codon:yes gene_type:complete
MKFSELEARGSDGFGSGHFGASRGGRSHSGFDLLCDAGVPLCSPVAGTVTKVGYPYGDDLSYRYVQVSAGGYDFRTFYIEPSVAVGDKVDKCSVIGTGQSLGKRYPGIPNHIHFEIKKAGKYVDPTPSLIAMGIEV